MDSPGAELLLERQGIGQRSLLERHRPDAGGGAIEAGPGRGELSARHADPRGRRSG